MQARRLPARGGWDWIVEGFRLFRRNPPLLTFVVFSYFLSLIVLDLVPLVGFLLAPICVPALSVSVMNGCRALAAGETPPASVAFSGFRRNARTLLLLGALYLAGSVAALSLSMLADGGLLFDIMLKGERPPAEALQDSRLMLAMQFTVLLMVPMLMAFWFAPPLAAWHDLGAGKALFFSFVACLRNWRAFLVYGAGAAFFSGILPGAALAVLGLVSESLARAAAVAVMLPLLFVFLPTLFASIFASYRAVFVAPQEAGGGSP